MRQAWEAKVKTILVLNKIDRLIIDKWMEPSEIQLHLSNIIENANSWIAELIMGELFQREQIIKQRRARASSASSNGSAEADSKWSEQDKIRFEKLREEALEKAEMEIFYSPEKGNVVFASAIDNWSFTIKSFAPKIAKPFGMNPAVLEKFLWGKFYFLAKEKKIVKVAPSNDS